MPAAIPIDIALPICIAGPSVDTNTVLSPNAWTRATSILRISIPRAKSSVTFASAFALMRVASASASAVRRMASASANASIFVRSAWALAAAMTLYASESASVYGTCQCHGQLI